MEKAEEISRKSQTIEQNKQEKKRKGLPILLLVLAGAAICIHFWLNSPSVLLAHDVGMELVIKFDAEQFRQTYLEEITGNLMSELMEAGLIDFSIIPIDSENLTVKVGEIGDEEYSAIDRILSASAGLEVKSPAGGSIKGAGEITLFINYEKGIQEAMDRSITIIKNRIDEFSAEVLSLKFISSDTIKIRIVGKYDYGKFCDILCKRGLLEFKLVKDVRQKATPPNDLRHNEEELLGRQFTDPRTGRKRMYYYIVESKALLTGDFLEDARVAFGSLKYPYVHLTFNSRGSKRFETITGENINRNLAIVLDGKVLTAPIIKQRIRDGQAVIESMRSLEEAQYLATILHTGALPIPVSIVEE